MAKLHIIYRSTYDFGCKEEDIDCNSARVVNTIRGKRLEVIKPNGDKMYVPDKAISAWWLMTAVQKERAK